MKDNIKINRKSLLISLLVFTSMWFVYYIFELVSGEIVGRGNKILTLVLPTLFFVILALVLNYCSRKIHRFKPVTIIVAIIVLTILEQLIKYIIRNNLNSNSNIELITNWLYIRPFLNSLGSWGASRFGLKLGINTFIFLNIIAVPILVQAYRCYIADNGKSFWLDMSFLLCLSGSICSLIDKVFFGGSLDYLNVGNLFIADLKDFYITISIGCFLNETIINRKAESDKSEEDKDEEIFRRFIQFNKMDLERIKKKFIN